jgi:D-aminopeptidase
MQEDESLIDVPFQAIAEATEEAILNALFKATRLVGYNGNVREALPINRVLDRLKQAGVLK